MKTIKEQIHNAISDNETWEESKQTLEQVVEDVAIQFLKWIGDNTHYNSSCWNLCETDESKTREELFEIFKKEKGL